MVFDGMLCDSLANGRGAQRKRVRQAIGKHAQPTAFVDVVHRGNHMRRGQYLKQPRQQIGRIGMAVHQIGSKHFEKAPGAHQADEDACRRFAHVEVHDIKAGRPLFRLARAKNDERNRVPTRSHPLGQCDRLAFRSAHA